MALKRFFIGMSKSEMVKMRILYSNADRVKLIPEERSDKINSMAMKLLFAKALTASCVAPLVYMLPIPLEPLLTIPIKLVIFSLGYRSIVYPFSMKVMNQVEESCKEFDLENRLEELDLPKIEREFIMSLQDKPKTDDNDKPEV